MNEDSPVHNELLLLQSAVECEVLKPKGSWKRIVGALDDYITLLEDKVKEMEKLRDVPVIESFSGEKKEEGK